MDIQKDYDEKGAASDAEPQSKLDATVTISTPDLVSSCEGSPLMLESFGILKPAEMTDLSNLTVSVEKLERPETNRNLDETFDAIPSEKIIQKIPNTTIVLKESDSISSHRQSLQSEPIPGPDASQLFTEIGSLKTTPSHLVGLTPCHSTPLNDLDEVLKVAAPFVDAIKHHDGTGCGGTNASNIELFPSKSTSILEAQVTLQCLAAKNSDSDVTNSNSKLQPLCLSNVRQEGSVKSPVMSTAKTSTQKASSEESKIVIKPKLPTIKSRERKQVTSKIHSPSPKPGPREMKGQVSSIGRVLPKHRSPLLKIALTKQSSLATPATRSNVLTPKLTTSSMKAAPTATKPTCSASGLLATALKPVSAVVKQTASSSRLTAGASNPTTAGTKFKLFSTFREKSTSTMSDKPIREKSTSTLSDKPVREKSTSTVSNKPVRQKSTSNLSDKPVREKSTSNLSDKPVRQKSTSNLSYKPVRQNPTSTIADKSTHKPTLTVQRSESNLLSKSKRSVDISSKSDGSAVESTTSNNSLNSKSMSSAEHTNSVLGSKSKSKVFLSNTTPALPQKNEKKGETTQGKNLKAKVLRKSISNLSTKKSMSNLPMPEAPTPNNNVLKIDSLGARPKTLSKTTSRTLSVRPVSTIESTLKSRQTGKGVEISASQVKGNSRTVQKREPMITASNSFIDGEVTVKPSLPQRSLSNLNPQHLRKIEYNFNVSGNGSSTSTSSFKMPRSPSQILKSRNSQPDLVKTISQGSELGSELSKAKHDLSVKSQQLKCAQTTIRNQNVAVDALVLVTKNLANELDRTENIFNDLQRWKSKYDSLQIEMENCKEGHKVEEKEFNERLANLGKDIENMCRKHEEDRDSIKEANHCKLEAQRLEFQEKLRKMKEGYERTIALSRENNEAELNRRNTQMEQSLVNEQALYEKKRKELDEAFAVEKLKSEEKIAQLESKVSDLVINLMNGPDHRDRVIAEMQKEVESLTAVLEIKSKEIKSLSEKNEKLCLKTASYNKIKVKVGNLESQVEDLKELLSIKRSNERKLDAELQELQESMNKTSLEKRRLSIEKEQLEWRINQGIHYRRRYGEDTQSQSFAGETQHSGARNFRTYHFRSPSLNESEPLKKPCFSRTLNCSPPSNCSTPSVLDFKANKASVSYQLDMSATSNSSTPGSAAGRSRRQRRFENGLGDRE